MPGKHTLRICSLCVIAIVIYLGIPWKSMGSVTGRLVPQQMVPVTNMNSTAAKPVTTMTATAAATTSPSLSTSRSTFPRPIVHAHATLNLSFFSQSDNLRLTEWLRRLNLPEYGHPRVLIYTWCSEDAYYKYANEVYWKSCYAHAHGFDIVFESKRNFSAIGWNWPMFNHGKLPDAVKSWAWVFRVHDYLASGNYDYVFMMQPEVLIQESNFHFPIWAWDRGHHITLMDQYHFQGNEAFGLNANNILFKSSDLSKSFLKELFEYRMGRYLLNDQGAFMETILVFLGREAAAKGGPGYNNACRERLTVLDEPFALAMENRPYDTMVKVEQYSQCFFSELNRFTGSYCHRSSNDIGFSPTAMDSNNGPLYPEQVDAQSNLGPWANCWRNVREYWPNPDLNCFAFRWSGPFMQALPGEATKKKHKVEGQCPDPSFNWDASPFNTVNRGQYLQEEPGTSILVQNQQTFFLHTDVIRHETRLRVLNLAPSNNLPRVLIYTWCTEEAFSKYVNEVYWKTCYAKMHGFDVVFAGSKNVSGMRPWEWSAGNFTDGRPAEEDMWAWWRDIQNYLSSGQYDYVFMIAPDTLILESNLDFPVWAWEIGHDITIMDSERFSWPDAFGVNANSILFRTSTFSESFLEEVFKYRKDFHVQVDGGPFMETLLHFLGLAAEAEGREGYDQKCFTYLKLSEPDTEILRHNRTKWMLQSDWYTRCFYAELDRLVGQFGNRRTQKIGFTGTSAVSNDGAALLPSQVHGPLSSLGPWANCVSSIRKRYPNPEQNCFAFRWSEPEDSEQIGQVRGKCPDPTFDWEASPYNPSNRRPASKAPS